MDASIMEGQDMYFGAVIGCAKTRYPIAAARWAMEKRRAHSPGWILQGPGVDRYAAKWGVPQVENLFFGTEARLAQWQQAKVSGRVGLDHGSIEKKHGTVGCVARDHRGALAAATSTGGLVNEDPARVSDSALIGAGTYADSRLAVSCTGEGERFVARCVAHQVASRVDLLNSQLEPAAQAVVHTVLPKGSGGLIAVGAQGDWTWPFNTPGMYRAAIDQAGVLRFGIHDEVDEINWDAAL